MAPVPPYSLSMPKLRLSLAKSAGPVPIRFTLAAAVDTDADHRGLTPEPREGDHFQLVWTGAGLVSEARPRIRGPTRAASNAMRVRMTRTSTMVSPERPWGRRMRVILDHNLLRNPGKMPTRQGEAPQRCVNKVDRAGIRTRQGSAALRQVSAAPRQGSAARRQTPAVRRRIRVGACLSRAGTRWPPALLVQLSIADRQPLSVPVRVSEYAALSRSLTTTRP